jgi:hypothetical protein
MPTIDLAATRKSCAQTDSGGNHQVASIGGLQALLRKFVRVAIQRIGGN